MIHSWGKLRRLNKLKKKNYFLFLAMDHGLTSGPILGIESIEKVNNWIDFSEKNNVPAVVLNHRYISKLNVFSETSLIVQTMGLPNKVTKNINKIPLTVIDELSKIDTTAISIQINFNVDNLQEAIQEVSKIVYEANKFQYPILFMIGNTDWKNYEEFNYAIRICCELGADLIKIRLPSESSIINKIDKFSKEHTPLLLSGGEQNDKFEDNIKIAKSLGFQGVCIGRNIFQSKNPINVLNTIDKVFNNE